MKATELYIEVLQHKNIFAQLHSRTAETDLKIIELLAKGKTVVQVSMDVPCAESTVYRTKGRAKQFLDEELLSFRTNNFEGIYIHNAVGLNTWNLSPRAWTLYLIFIRQHQQFKNTIEGKYIHKLMPGLTNQSQRSDILAELNHFAIIPNEQPQREIKVFQYVSYEKAKYSFRLTNEALPYFDKGYAFFKMLGIEDWLE